ncbi:hypothetical protein Acr_29g0004690 [Actinidia rufa]|uniref:Uncharacterized protein n=1 Tax=Actinidia rufa TaxID=165716 RepID=A0A7J0HDV1_9ERIC|nr:hypothetical protein Acr_29g0004690 [Actinidia rufa]
MLPRISLSTLNKKARKKKVVTKDDVLTSLKEDRQPREMTSGCRPRPYCKEGLSGRFKGQGGHATTPPKRTKSNKGASNAAVRTSPLGTPFTLPGDNLGLFVASSRARLRPCPPEPRSSNDYHFRLTWANLAELKMASMEMDADLGEEEEEAKASEKEEDNEGEANHTH